MEVLLRVTSSQLKSCCSWLRLISGDNIPPWPRHIKHLKASKALEVVFTDGRSFTLPAELLRVSSPAVNSRRGKQAVVAGRKHVSIMNIESVGNYALRLQFDDLHNTGLYTWEHLYDLGSNKLSYMRAYLRLLKLHGLSRDPRVKPTQQDRRVKPTQHIDREHDT